MNKNDSQKIIQQLRAQQLLTNEQVLALTAEAPQTGKDMVNLALEKNFVNEEELTKIKASVLGLPYVHLVNEEIPNDVLNILSQDIAENYRVVPWFRQGSVVSIAMVDPRDFKTIEVLDFIARKDKLQLKYFLTSDSSMYAVLRQYANLSKEVAQALEAQEPGDAMEDELEQDVDASVQSAPVSKMVAVILRYAVEGNASDVHIEPTGDDTRVRYRVDGELHTSLHVPKKIHNAVVARIKVLANLKLDEMRLPQDGRFHMNIEGREVDFRVSTLPLIGREKVVLRILDKETGIHSLEALGYADRNLKIVHKHLESPHGMILVTGPTGSGKSTTLYSMLLRLNKEERNIITLEDPVEYNMPGISQSQIKPEIGLTFATGLRSILRQDPDIVMIGEIRDNETAELAVHAALTGHMVLSTLHTNDAMGAIPRLLDMKIEPFLISSSLNVVIAQRLVRKICNECREEILLPVDLERKAIAEIQSISPEFLPQDISTKLPLKVYKGKGCQRCDNTGYKGRTAISEVLEVTDRLEQIIASSEINKYDVTAGEMRRQGMITLKQDGLIKALRGITTVEEVWNVTEE